MNEYYGFIYEWTHTTTGMKYIGSHKGHVNDGYIGSGLRFNNAVKKYGIENFERIILEYVMDDEGLKNREQYYLDIYECASSPNYYNISHSSTGGNMGQNYKLISERMKENNPNAGGNSRRAYNKKYGSPNIGYKHTEESKLLFKESKLGDKNPRYGKPGTMRSTTYLVNAETKLVDYAFESLEAAEKFLNVNHTTVWYNRKRNRPHKGYYWCVGDDELQLMKETK